MDTSYIIGIAIWITIIGGGIYMFLKYIDKKNAKKENVYVNEVRAKAEAYAMKVSEADATISGNIDEELVIEVDPEATIENHIKEIIEGGLKDEYDEEMYEEFKEAYEELDEESKEGPTS